MARRNPDDLSLRLVSAMRRQGAVATSAELQALLGVSQATVSRALAPLLRSGEVLQSGAARRCRYLLARHLAGTGSQLPIVRVDAHGQATPFGRMTALQGGHFWVDEVDGVSERHAGLPWFLDDMRPQGFMGLTFARAHPSLELAQDPRRWSVDDTVKALACFGDDLPGNLIVGEPAFERFHTLSERSSQAASPDDYPAMAGQAMQGTLPGSSAGGEQPKFCTQIDGRHVLVKFSPAGESPADQRIRDLLVCEHLALRTLAQAGVPAAATRLFFIGHRMFLESERFDRTRAGRIGMVSLEVYDAQYVGKVDNWAATAGRMQAQSLLQPQDAAQLRLLEAYGVLIANTDRHYGNISLLLEADDWRLSPTYDMLPMLYAPVNGELVPRDFGARPLRPTTATLAEWGKAAALASMFWQAAALDKRISPDFRAIAQANLQTVEGV